MSTNRQSALARQEGGEHYQGMAIQPAEFIRANGLPHAEGEAIFHIARHRAKNGAEDLRKAIHWLEIILELDYAGHGEELPEVAAVRANPAGVIAEMDDLRGKLHRAEAELAELRKLQAAVDGVTGDQA